ncbi:MAG: C-GCAxxG-C-C family protein [Lachnospiraceae bacterium]
MRSRIEEAVNMFESGYNCAQSIFATYADLYGMDRETALRLSSPLGAGIGRMREVCGTVSGMAMLAGLENGNTDPTDEAGKKAIYEQVRQMSDTFKEQTGSIICRDLLGIAAREASAAPELRSAQYYAKRPCSRMVATAAKIIEEQLLADFD